MPEPDRGELRAALRKAVVATVDRSDALNEVADLLSYVGDYDNPSTLDELITRYAQMVDSPPQSSVTEEMLDDLEHDVRILMGDQESR